MKKTIKKVFRWMKEQIVWLTNRRVWKAINSDATYEEVCQIVKEEMEK